jgi:hypothetical protein
MYELTKTMNEPTYVKNPYKELKSRIDTEFRNSRVETYIVRHSDGSKLFVIINGLTHKCIDNVQPFYDLDVALSSFFCDMTTYQNMYPDDKTRCSKRSYEDIKIAINNCL